MELGRVAEIDTAKENNVEKVQVVQELDNKQKIVQEDQHDKVNNKNNDNVDPNEIILDNVKFGYNKNSKDFFVKITRGESEYKYPTEEMMRVKAQLLGEIENSNKI